MDELQYMYEKALRDIETQRREIEAREDHHREWLKGQRWDNGSQEVFRRRNDSSDKRS